MAGSFPAPSAIPENEPPYQTFCDDYGTPTATLVVYDNDVPFASHTVFADENTPNQVTNVPAMWERYFKPKFESLFATLTMPNAPEITRRVETRLEQLQQSLYAQVSRELANGSLALAANELAGAKMLLDAFVDTGFSNALDDDDFFHALLFGEQRVIDREQVQAAFTLSATQPISGAALLVNPRVQLAILGERRNAALRERGLRQLSAIGTNTHTEFVSVIADTRQTLRMAMLEMETPADPGGAALGRRVFAPIVFARR